MSVESHLELLRFGFNMLFGWIKTKDSHTTPEMIGCLHFLAHAADILSLVHCFSYDCCDFFSFVLDYRLFLSPFRVVMFTMTQNCLVMDIKMKSNTFTNID